MLVTQFIPATLLTLIKLRGCVKEAIGETAVSTSLAAAGEKRSCHRMAVRYLLPSNTTPAEPCPVLAPYLPPVPWPTAAEKRRLP